MKKFVLTVLMAPVLGLAGAPGDSAEWTLETIRDKATYQDVAVLQQASSVSISDEYGTQEVRPRLEFRCVPMSADGINVRIDWQRFISSFNTEVRFAADGKEAITVTLGVDRSNEITSTRADGDNAKIMQYLRGQSSLAVTVTPYSEVPVTVKYGLSGFDENLAELENACSG